MEVFISGEFRVERKGRGFRVTKRESASVLRVRQENWSKATRALSGKSGAAIGSYISITGFSFECLLVASWRHLMSCYSTTDLVPSGSVREYLNGVSVTLAMASPGAEELGVLLELEASQARAFSLVFDSERVSPDMIEMLADCVEEILQQIPQYEARNLSELPLISEELFSRYCRPFEKAGQVDASVCIHEWIEEQCRRKPRNICAVSAHEQLTFAALSERANQLARYLVRRGCGPETIVAVHLSRSIDLLIALLAVLKSGAAFLPLDASLPEGRVQGVIEDSNASLILTKVSLGGRFERWLDRVVCLDSQKLPWRNESTKPLPSRARPENLAYVTYTSGSTGKPKGVMIEHRNLAAFANAFEEVLGKGPGVYLATTNISFDTSVVEFLWSLSRGFKIVVHEGEEGLPLTSGPESLASQIIEHGVTHVQGTPSLMRIMLTDERALEALRRLQKLFLGGEPFPPALASTLLAHASGDVINAYGPTETTIASTFHFVRQSETKIPIGKPLRNTFCYVLDKHGRLLPPLAPGELFIGGASVARGYLHRPDLTAERFHQNPFDRTGQTRIYRTGDLVRLRVNGDFEFVGRLDSQVKIRGYRIELGEIESVMEKLPGIEHAAVLVKEGPSGEKSLVGYYSAAQSDLLEPARLQEHLEGLLPSYMVPAVLRSLDHFPLTPTGKVDRAKLAEFATTGTRENREPGSGGQKTSPVIVSEAVADSRLKEIESVLCSWCSALLQIPIVKPLDDFLEIGGHSLIAAQLAQQIARTYGKNIRLSVFLKARTMRALAEVVLREQDEQSIYSPVVHLRKAAAGTPLFLIAGLGGNALNFEFISRLLPGRPIYGVETHGLDDQAQVLSTVEDMARYYLKIMQRAQPKGPYHIVGYSFGGILAFEMAQQLRAGGHEVGILGLVDTAEWHHIRSRMASLSLLKRLNHLYGATLKQIVLGPRRLETLYNRVKATLEHYKLSAHARSGRPASSTIASTEHRNFYALTNYAPKPYDADIHLFRCSDGGALREDTNLGWDRLSRDVIVAEILGEHESIFSDPLSVESLGTSLRNVLEQSDSLRKRTLNKKDVAEPRALAKDLATKFG